MALLKTAIIGVKPEAARQHEGDPGPLKDLFSKHSSGFSPDRLMPAWCPAKLPWSERAPQRPRDTGAAREHLRVRRPRGVILVS